ncbi:hypothetical protein [Xanthocytophaga agilis]|uniref:Uncharacterized protein n=1 Tax=Xanthocytophaga agilis TaxID=3048010 RepID=A0AAE3R6C6_9BACT|nr:hypothetical protein [Xanthocytophaga agilis]MDJ1502422.1 hypothetical protein [Xanthocytophaga agilis]
MFCVYIRSPKLLSISKFAYWEVAGKSNNLLHKIMDGSYELYHQNLIKTLQKQTKLQTKPA